MNQDLPSNWQFDSLSKLYEKKSYSLTYSPTRWLPRLCSSWSRLIQFVVMFYQSKVHDKHHFPMTQLELYMNSECGKNSYLANVRTLAIVLRIYDAKREGNPCCQGFVPCRTNVNSNNFERRPASRQQGE